MRHGELLRMILCMVIGTEGECYLNLCRFGALGWTRFSCTRTSELNGTLGGVCHFNMFMVPEEGCELVLGSLT